MLKRLVNTAIVLGFVLVTVNGSGASGEFAGSGVIFQDGFETGDTSAWSEAVGLVSPTQALSLDRAAGQYLTIPGSGILLPDDFTLALWVRPRFGVPPEENMLLSKWSATPSEKSWIFSYQSAGVDQMALRLFVVPSGSDVDRLVEREHTLTPGEWAHVAVVKEGGTATFYVNGHSIGSDSGLLASVDQTSADVQLGTRNDLPGSICDCDFDEARIYGRALTNSEVAALVPTRCTGTEPDLMACWSFDGNFDDGSSNMEDFLPVNMPTFVADGPPLLE